MSENCIIIIGLMLPCQGAVFALRLQNEHRELSGWPQEHLLEKGQMESCQASQVSPSPPLPACLPAPAGAALAAPLCPYGYPQGSQFVLLGH